MIKAYWAEKGIILECEAPQEAPSPEERLVRERRIAFYERNGAFRTSYLWRAFDVDYAILCLPGQSGIKTGDIPDRLTRLYQCAMPERMLRRFTNISEPEQ